MKREFFIIILAITAFITLTVVSCKQKDSPAQTDISNKAHGFTLTNYDSRKISLSDYKGKIIVLEWFNYDCPFVKHHYETNAMPQLAAKYKAKGVIWLAVNSTHYATAEKNKEFVEIHKVGYPILSDKDGKIGRAYNAKTTPHMFIIDTKGLIGYKGAIDNSPLGSEKEVVINYVDKVLTEMLEAKPISTKETEPYGCSVKYSD